MSDAPQGPGWWQATDQRWYPPQQGTTQAPIYVAAPFAVAPRNSGSATAALVLAILAWFLCPFVGAVIAIVLAFSAKSEIRKANGTIQGDGMATAAIVISSIHLALAGLIAAFFLLAAIGAGSSSTNNSSPPIGRPAPVVAYV